MPSSLLFPRLAHWLTAAILPLMLLLGMSARASADAGVGDDPYCLAAAIHIESAGQSPATKTGVGYWIVRRAIEEQQTVCTYLLNTKEIAAIPAALIPGTWAFAVWHHGDLALRQRGAESLEIAAGVLTFTRPGYFFADHFDSCDSRAGWVERYERLRLDPGDSLCFWR